MRNRLSLFLLVWLCCSLAVLGQYAAPVAPQTPAANTAQKKPPVVCPWLSQGTAAKMLGGDVSVTANVSDSGEGDCKFTRDQGPPDTLEIVMSKAALPGCQGDGVPLRGIGNEAAMCRRAGPRGEVIEMISSRVRDQHFTVTINSRGLEKTANAQDAQEEPIARIAEQVAGSLY